MIYKNIKKVFLYLILVLLFILMNSFAVFADYYCPTCQKTYSGEPNSGLAGNAVCRVCKNFLDTSAGNYFNQKGERLSHDEIIEKYPMLHGMFNDICSIENTNNNDSSILNTDSMMQTIFNSAKETIEKIGNSSIYYCFTGVGIFILVFNFCFSIYDKDSLSDKMTTEQMLKMLFKLIICLFLIVNVKKIMLFFVLFCQWILKNIIDYKNSGVLSVEGIDGSSVADDLFVNLIREQGLDKKGWVDEKISFFGQVFLMLPLTIPWLISFVGKFGIIFAICKSAIEMVSYAVPYPIAAGDCYENIKNSRFMSYTKQIFACSLQISIIVIITMVSQVLLQDVLKSIFENMTKLSTAQVSSTKVFSSIFLLSAIQLSRMAVVLSSAPIIASKVAGV